MTKRNNHTDLNAPATKGDLLMMNRRQDEMMEILLGVAQNTRPKQFYTIAEFSAILGPKEPVIQKLCIKGELAASQVKKGGTWCIEGSEIDRMRKQALENRYSNSKPSTRTQKAILKKMGISWEEPNNKGDKA